MHLDHLLAHWLALVTLVHHQKARLPLVVHGDSGSATDLTSIITGFTTDSTTTTAFTTDSSITTAFTTDSSTTTTFTTDSSTTTTFTPSNANTSGITAAIGKQL